MLRDKVIPCLLEHNVLDKVIFMQDGGPPHITTKVKQFLTNEYSAATSHMNLKLRSLDLKLVDFFLWGYVKSRVYFKNQSS